MEHSTQRSSVALGRPMSAGRPAGCDTALLPTALACMFTLSLNAVKVGNK